LGLFDIIFFLYWNHPHGNLLKVNPDVIQALTGHKSIRQAEHYAGISYQSQGAALGSVAKELMLSK